MFMKIFRACEKTTYIREECGRADNPNGTRSCTAMMRDSPGREEQLTISVFSSSFSFISVQKSLEPQWLKAPPCDEGPTVELSGPSSWTAGSGYRPGKSEIRIMADNRFHQGQLFKQGGERRNGVFQNTSLP